MSAKEVEFKVRAEVAAVTGNKLVASEIFLKELPQSDFRDDAIRLIREVIDYAYLAARKAEREAAEEAPPRVVPEQNPAAAKIRARIEELESTFEEGMYGMEHHLEGLREALTIIEGGGS